MCPSPTTSYSLTLLHHAVTVLLGLGKSNAFVIAPLADRVLSIDAEPSPLAGLRQYCHDLTAMPLGRSVEYERQGWRDRRSRSYNTKLVRTLDLVNRDHILR